MRGREGLGEGEGVHCQEKDCSTERSENASPEHAYDVVHDHSQSDNPFVSFHIFIPHVLNHDFPTVFNRLSPLMQLSQQELPLQPNPQPPLTTTLKGARGLFCLGFLTDTKCPWIRMTPKCIQ